MIPEQIRQPDANRPQKETPVPLALGYQPRVLPNAVDVTGLVPDEVHVDPYITAGHPGYEESGESQIIPMDRLTGGQSSAG